MRRYVLSSAKEPCTVVPEQLLRREVESATLDREQGCLQTRPENNWLSSLKVRLNYFYSRGLLPQCLLNFRSTCPRTEHHIKRPNFLSICNSENLAGSARSMRSVLKPPGSDEDRQCAKNCQGSPRRYVGDIKHTFEKYKFKFSQKWTPGLDCSTQPWPNVTTQSATASCYGLTIPRWTLTPRNLEQHMWSIMPKSRRGLATHSSMVQFSSEMRIAQRNYHSSAKKRARPC